jgi:hypothetical protein
MTTVNGRDKYNPANQVRATGRPPRLPNITFLAAERRRKQARPVLFRRRT